MPVSQVKALLLAAGLGTRLRPLTENWPKCLMPIGERPLLEYWLQTFAEVEINEVLVNLHYFADEVSEFLARPCFTPVAGKRWIHQTHEPQLLGTAGTLRANQAFCGDSTLLLVHADNWCRCDFADFISYHQYRRPQDCLITMMTFDTDQPENCGIVEVDSQGRIQAFYEKVSNPPGKRANAAVYLIEPEVVNWLRQNPQITDFSTEVLPQYIGRIAGWHNTGIHRDIGSTKTLIEAQSDPMPQLRWPGNDSWAKQFSAHPIHKALESATRATFYST